ncbi:FtsW/RodA/SpoVE family cell cycle protein [Oleiphilus sp. HI0132]|nr:FtsW/RodA/SpoVE family cell cycle protein [Oleiphilus sp. HI0132]
MPLVSYGGSSLIVSCMCIGVLLRIHRDLMLIEDEPDSEQARDKELIHA